MTRDKKKQIEEDTARSLKMSNARAPMPFVLSLPHCSDRIPVTLKPFFALTDDEIKVSTDLGVLQIFGGLPALAILKARWSRLVVDLNRGPDQHDVKGVIAHVDYHGRNIYGQGCLPDSNEVKRRIGEYHRPFHHDLREAIGSPGIKGLFDCHSLCGTGPREAPDYGKSREDIILGNNGDKNGKATPVLGESTCPPETMRLIRRAFEAAGFSVSFNNPYSGGFIINHYGKILTERGKFAVQIEINQDLYIKTETLHFDNQKLKRVEKRVLEAFEEIAGKL